MVTPTVSKVLDGVNQWIRRWEGGDTTLPDNPFEGTKTRHQPFAYLVVHAIAKGWPEKDILVEKMLAHHDETSDVSPTLFPYINAALGVASACGHNDLVARLWPYCTVAPTGVFDEALLVAVQLDDLGVYDKLWSSQHRNFGLSARSESSRACWVATQLALRNEVERLQTFCAKLWSDGIPDNEKRDMGVYGTYYGALEVVQWLLTNPLDETTKKLMATTILERPLTSSSHDKVFAQLLPAFASGVWALALDDQAAPPLSSKQKNIVLHTDRVCTVIDALDEVDLKTLLRGLKERAQADNLSLAGEEILSRCQAVEQSRVIGEHIAHATAISDPLKRKM